MTIPDAAPPPSRGKEVLVEFPQDELIAKWEEFFEEMGYLSKIIAVADRYPESRSLEASFLDLNRFDTDMAIYLLRHPLNVLMAGEEAIRECDEVQTPDGDVPVPGHAEDRGPRIAGRPAGRRGAAAADRLRGRRLDRPYHTRAARDPERRAPKRPARTTGTALDPLRHLHGRELGRDGTRRVRGDRGDGGGRPSDPGHRIEPGYLPVDHRIDRALNLRDARGEGSPRPPAVRRGREAHARRAADSRGHPFDPGRRSGDGQERALVVHDPTLSPRNLRHGEGRLGGGRYRVPRPCRVRRRPLDARSGSPGPRRSRARRNRRDRENESARPVGDPRSHGAAADQCRKDGDNGRPTT